MKDCNKAEFFLATTALKCFWDTSKPMIFLADWCIPYGEKKYFNGLDYAVINYSNYKFNQDIDDAKLQNIYESLLLQLSKWLNRTHRKDYSLRYWRILIGPFLYWYVQAIHARYTCLHNVCQKYSKMSTIGLSESSYFSPINTEEFCDLTNHSDAWNLQLFTQILNCKFKIPILYKDYDWSVELKQRLEKSTIRPTYRMFTKILRNFVRILSNYRRKKIFGLYSPVFNRKHLLKLMFFSGLRIVPILPFEEKTSLVAETNVLNSSLRSELCEIHTDDELSKLIVDTLQWNMPLNFIENYQLEFDKSKQRLPYVIGASLGSWMADDSCKFWGALNAESGMKIIDLQHGGGYGVLKSHSYSFLEQGNADFFISWGWKNSNKVIPIPSIYVCQFQEFFKKKLSFNDNKKSTFILWAVTEFSKYPFELISVEQSRVYFSDQVIFLSKLLPKVFSAITMRIRHSCWSEKWKIIRDKFPTLNIYETRPNDKASFFKQLNSTDILVVDNLNTVYLSGLAFNIPTIIFWDKKFWQLTDYAKPYFKMLHEVGIYHDSPESAAAMLNKIADNPMSWWGSKPVQLARQYFCENYARSRENWMIEWKNALVAIVNNKV